MKVIFDYDGTLCDISHRVRFVRGTTKPDWKAFFQNCVLDEPKWPIIDTLRAHLIVGHHVEIWSGRSDEVREQSEAWLRRHDIPPSLLTRMRKAGDHQPDTTLKESWLHSLPREEWPSLVYDDRLRIVEMWRKNGIQCAQVEWGDFDTKPSNKIVPPTRNALLTILVGPSCAGKSTYARQFPTSWVLSSDALRQEYTGTIENQSRNEDVFLALHRMAKARLDSGLPVVIDATNLVRKDRLACVALAPAGAGVRYVVLNRPMAQKIDSGGWRNNVIAKNGMPLIEMHEQRFRSQLKDILSGDGNPDIEVLDLRAGS